MSCENSPQLFITTFTYSDVAKKITTSQTKASYSVTDGLGDLTRKDLSKEVHATNGGFARMFDKTTTNQSKKQIDLLRLNSCC